MDAGVGKNGRPREHFTWNQFTDPWVPDNKKFPVAQCIHCKGQHLAAKLTRLRNHLARCDKFRRNTDKSNYTSFMISNNFSTEINLIKLYGPGYAISAQGTKLSGEMYGPGSTSHNTNLEEESDSPTPPKRNGGPLTTYKQTCIETFVDRRLTPEEKDHIDYMLARYIHLEGIAFDAFNNEHGAALLRAFRPSYGAPPSRELISGKFLIRHEADVMADVINDITTCFGSVGMTTDGWTDANSAQLHNMMVCSPVPYLLGSSRNPAGTEDAVSLVHAATDMGEQIVAFFDQKGIPRPRLIGLCTDSPNGNKGMRSELLLNDAAKELNIIPYGCVCHALNNFGKDVSKLGLLPKVFEQAKVIAAVFRNVKHCKHHLNKVQIAKYNSTRQLLMPVDTRWNTNLSMLTSIQRTKDALLELDLQAKHQSLVPAIDLTKEFSGKNTAAMDGSKISASALINDPMFWKRLDQAVMMLKPIARCVTYLEGDMAPISMVPAAFLKLMLMFKALAAVPDDDFVFNDIGLKPRFFENKQQHMSHTLPDLLRRRWSEMTAHTVCPARPGVFSGLLQLALYLDMATRSLCFLATTKHINLDSRPIPEGVLAGAAFLEEKLKGDPRYKHELEKDVVSDLRAALLTGSAQFLETTEPTSWYLGYSKHPLGCCLWDYSALGLFARHIFSLPASAAGGERSFNVYGSIHTKKRNRLSGQMLDTLAKVKMNTNQLKRRQAYVQDDARSDETMAWFYDFNFRSDFGALRRSIEEDEAELEQMLDDADAAAVQPAAEKDEEYWPWEEEARAPFFFGQF